MMHDEPHDELQDTASHHTPRLRVKRTRIEEARHATAASKGDDM